MWSPLRHHLGYEKIRRNKLLYNVVVCRSCWPCPINACLLRKEVQAVLLECLSAGSWLVKYSPEIWFWGCCFFTNIWQFFSFFTQTQQQCFYLLSSKWSSWVIIINIFHIWCSVVGREQRTFVSTALQKQLTCLLIQSLHRIWCTKLN